VNASCFTSWLLDLYGPELINFGTHYGVIVEVDPVANIIAIPKWQEAESSRKSMK
jgi:hypothetical protein